jgi:predicted porin
MKTDRVCSIVTLGLLLLPAYAGGAASQEDRGTSTETVTCQSDPGERRHCKADTSAGVALMEQTSSEPCLLGKTWGYDDEGLWVEDGCRGRFVIGGTRTVSDNEDQFARKFQPYGLFQAHLSASDDEAEIQDNVSWLGLRFETGKRVKLFAHLELGTNLIGNVDQLRAGARTDSGLLTLERLESPDVFGPRLGYLGVDLGSAGRITMGKDNGMHYSIASYTTDRWNAFGGQGSIAFPAGGDGGASGTGRADQVVNYRVTLAKLVELGVQAQFNNSQNDELLDGYGASLQVTILPGVKIGGAYTQMEIADLIEGEILGVQGDAEYAILGVQYSSDVLDVGAVWATQDNGDARLFPVQGAGEAELVPVVFDGSGFEIFVRSKLGKWGILGGYIDYDPDTAGRPFDADFRDRYFILGADYEMAAGAGAYTEFRIDDSVGATGEESSSVGVVGLKYTFSWNATHNP